MLSDEAYAAALKQTQKKLKPMQNIILEQLSEKIDKGTKLFCDICGRKVTVDVKGTGPLICCGKKMEIIK